MPFSEKIEYFDTKKKTVQNKLEWKNQGFLYTVALRNGEEEDLIKIANSAIQAGKR